MNPGHTGPWEDALAHVPGAQSGADLRVRPLAGGTTNATFRVETREGTFVVRLHEPYTLDLGVDRRREAVLHAAAAAAGLASRILAADPQGRYLVTEFLTTSTWRAADLADESRLRQLAQTLGELHALPAPEMPPLDLARLLDHHIAQIAAQDGAVTQELLSQVTHARDILARQADAGRPACIIHGDLTHSNLMGTEPLRLIDWEYAAVGDPLADLACLLAYYPRVLPQGALLLQQCGLAGSAPLEALEDLAWVYRLISDLWYRRLALARLHRPPAH
ncbi:MAG TPA: phosphotransferase [Steroidobacteraceae bacterium]|jgi:aminoglycoside phosphotransferase (APT) family kinase protein